MSTAELADGLAEPVARAAVARVLGVDAAALRADTPLKPLGWDSLACVCWSDAVVEAGWHADTAAASRASSVADLTNCLIGREGAP